MATPGRLCDHLKSGSTNLKRCTYLVYARPLHPHPSLQDPAAMPFGAWDDTILVQVHVGPGIELMPILRPHN